MSAKMTVREIAKDFAPALKRASAH